MSNEQKSIHISTSVPYDVIIGQGLLEEAGHRIRDLGGIKKALIVSDDHVFPIYGESLRKSLEQEGILTETFVFPHGEQSKCMAVYEQLLEYAGECRLTRSDCFAALGGGVAGDLCGFAAATYQRGIRFIQIPTSLLAAVDSSVGGKTAVNLRSGKNQAGCFYQPSLVICDTDTLKTLPETEFKNGCAEVIKYGMIMDAGFFRRLKEQPAAEWILEVIASCVSMKRELVEKDEFDTGIRMLLNFGHTIGHGVEKCSNYEIPHGYAVAMGMAAVTKAAVRNSVCSEETCAHLIEVLARYGLPADLPYSAEELIKAAMADKKAAGTVLRLIVPEEIGRCVIRTIKTDELKDWIA